MESDSFKKDLIKKDILEVISEEWTNKAQSVQTHASNQNDLSNVLIKLKQTIEQIEGDLNSEANELLKQLSIVLCEMTQEAQQEGESVVDGSPPLLVRQGPYIISKDKRLDSVGPSHETLSTEMHHKLHGHSLYDKLTEAFENFNLKEKVIVVLLEPEFKHNLEGHGLISNRLSNIRPQTSLLQSPSHFSNKSLNVPVKQVPAIPKPLRTGFGSPNQNSPKQMHQRVRSSTSTTHLNRRSLSPNASIRSCPIYSKQNQMMKSTSKIPTPQKSKFSGSTRNLSGSVSLLNSLVKQQNGSPSNRPVTVCQRSSFSSPVTFHGNTSPYGHLQKKN